MLRCALAARPRKTLLTTAWRLRSVLSCSGWLWHETPNTPLDALETRTL